MIEVLAISSKSSLLSLSEGVFCVGFLVAELNGADISKVYAVKRNRSDAYKFAAAVTADTPVLSSPIQELFHELVATGQLQPKE